MSKLKSCDRFHSLALLILASCVLPAICAAQPDTCALTIEIKATNGFPIRSTRIELLDASHKVIGGEYSAGAVVRLCDFGFELNAIRVGAYECMPVVLEKISYRPGYPMRLEAVLNSCPGGASSGNGCLVYFRISNVENQRIPGVQIARFLQRADVTADEYGRAETAVRKGTRQDFVFEAEGYKPRSVTVSCQAGEWIKKEVHLDKE